MCEGKTILAEMLHFVFVLRTFFSSNRREGKAFCLAPFGFLPHEKPIEPIPDQRGGRKIKIKRGEGNMSQECDIAIEWAAD